MNTSAALLLAVLFVAASAEGPRRKGEFIAGSFILTQKSLNEAPYRYAGVLRKALDTVETKDPPSRSDENNCNVRYRIRPSGRRSKLRIVENTLSITLKENNTVVVGAKLDVEVHAKTWIWKGISFGFLGCLKLNSCNGQVVTYTADVDFNLAFTVDWDDQNKKLAIKIKPVETAIRNVNVAGCHPPWYLSWFRSWQRLLNRGVQRAFAEYANKYERLTEVPQKFSPLQDVYIDYTVTDFTWKQDFVIFHANATFSTEIDGKNVTFMPSEMSGGVNKQPLEDNWNMTSPQDGDSHLLQGVRVSTEFMNSLMWYATVKNKTRYHGAARVLDSNINGTISYTPPVIKVEQDNLLSIGIGAGLVLATCRPVNETAMKDVTAAYTRRRKANGTEEESETLFKAEFSDLAGSGRVKLASTKDQTGISISLDHLDLTRMSTKPFEPKLPLPEAFETELMKNGISQLQPVVNQYLEEKPLYLPDDVAPFAAAPQLYLWQTGNGTGFAEILSYCTCNPVSGSSEFATCDPRSHICDGLTPREHKVDVGPTTEKSGILPGVFNDVVQDGIKNIIAVANNVVNSDDEDDADNGKSNVQYDTLEPLNFTAMYEEAREGLYKGFHFTFFEEDDNCRLDVPGSTAKVYWLWKTGRCSPLYLHGKETAIYYNLNGTVLSFGCDDKECSSCEHTALHLDPDENGLCHDMGGGQSYRLGKPDIHNEWYGNDSTIDNAIVNVFFSTNDFCAFHPRYVEPQLLSSHTNLGQKKSLTCFETGAGDYANMEIENETLIQANWDCNDRCFGCEFRVGNVNFSTCHFFQEGIKMEFTTSVFKLPEVDVDKCLNEKRESLQNVAMYVAIGCAVALTILVVGIVAVWTNKPKRRKKTPPQRVFGVEHGAQKADVPIPEPKKNSLAYRRQALRAFFSANFGNRFATWHKEKDWTPSRRRREIQDDAMQNVMLLANGVLAILFAIEWNSDHNPLLIIHNKFKDGFTVSIDVFDTLPVAEFAERLNFLTYLVNLANAGVAFLIVILWCITKTGRKATWMKIRLLSAISMLASIFIVIAAVIFSTYFDGLVVLRADQGHFITDNDSVHSMASEVLRLVLNGLSLTVVSFTIVFLFHGVGGGLYCGTVIFRVLNLRSKRENLEILTTLLVILTVIQPFVSIHPVIIWSQDSSNNSTFLLLVILIWFLPVVVHVIVKTIAVNGRLKCESKIDPEDEEEKEDGDGEFDGIGSKVRLRGESSEEAERRYSRRKRRLLTFFDLFVQILQLSFFLATFSLVTHHIVHTEFGGERRNLRDFVLPAITSVFVWMVNISYLLLAIVMDKTKTRTRLVFKDQNLEQARNRMRESLKERLATLDARASRARTIGDHRSRSRGRGRAGGHGHMAEEAISLSDSMNMSKSRRRTMPAELNLSESMKGRMILPRDSQMFKVLESAPTKNPDQDISALKESRKDERRRAKQLSPLRNAPPAPPLVAVERGKKLGREKFALLPIVRSKEEGEAHRMRTAEIENRRRSKSEDVDPKRAKDRKKSVRDDQSRPRPTREEEVPDRGRRRERRERDRKQREKEEECPDDLSTSCTTISTVRLETEGSEGTDSESEAADFWNGLKRVYHFVMEKQEYNDPYRFGWRIKYRRFCLTLGVITFTYLTVYTALSTQQFNSKDEIQRILDYAGTNLTWPDSGSVLDDVFQLYNSMERAKSYIMVCSSVLFWASLVFDLSSVCAGPKYRTMLFTGSRVTNFCGSLAIFAGVVVVGLPDYLAASRLDEICPFCGKDFNGTVKQVAEFSIGLFFACLFTFQLLPILITIVPALVRAAILILIHPSLALDENEATTLRMNILQQVVQFSSLLTFPITFISMAIIQQYQKNLIVTVLILLFWTFPPTVLFLGLHYTRRFRRYTILLYVYYLYNFCYFAILFSLLLFSLNVNRIVELLQGLMQEPTFWASSLSQVFLCNIVISDMLYMTVF